MLSKFETKSNRVKGLTFHPKRPWILASLHSGSIQLWDYKLGTLVERFDEHEGPVRACSFHPIQPLFASGGDDYKLKVWNWKLARCQFTLLGHLDYIRMVSFHNEAPWIISCGDDQTIRIWNWQSRTCISVLTGHSHYVMTAFFHHSQDLVLSACLDQTVRVWDISGLRKKHAAGSTAIHDDKYGLTQGGGGGGNVPGGPNSDVFGNLDCVVKYVLEGHSRGVNWASFHPTLPLIISCGDDRLIKLWRMNDNKAWEVDTCRGHFNNISAVFFHSAQDVIVSAAEDKTIRVWDMQKRTCISTFRRENDRFWSLAMHPTMNLFAAGHDTGLVVFKLERERPGYDIHNDVCYYISNKTVRAYNFTAATDTPLINIRRGHPGQLPAPRTLSYNPAENAIIIQSGKDDGYFEIYTLPRVPNPSGQAVDADPKRGVHISATIYVARNRFATLEKGKLFIKDLHNVVIKEIGSVTGLDGKIVKPIDIFFAGGRNILVGSATSIILFDTENRTALYDFPISNMRYVSWSADQSHLAVLCKHNIAILNNKLEQVALVHETIKIKSGAWDPTGVFVYSTLNHIKYSLVNGDIGIIKTIEQPIYVVRVKNNLLHVLNRQGKMQVVAFDPTEYRFKLALVNRNYDEVMHLIKTSNLMGQSIIGYLQKKGYPEIALQFVKDPKTRFDLAIECGNIDAALEMAKTIDKEQYWSKLGMEALRQGNQLVIEFVYQRTKNYDKLSLLYLCTGNTDKLKKMLKIAEARKDPMSRFQNALYCGDVHDQVQTLKEAGQYPLAYLTAQTHGLYDLAQEILILAGKADGPPPPILPTNTLLRAPHAALKQSSLNWPQLQVSKNVFESGGAGSLGHEPVSAVSAAAPDLGVLDDQALEDTGDWGGDEDLDDLGNIVPKIKSPTLAAPEADAMDEEEEGGGWDLDDDLEIGSVGSPTSVKGPQAPVVFTPPKHGLPPSAVWVKNSSLAIDHIAGGSFETAMQLLNKQLGIVNFAPLKPFFLSIYQASSVYLAGAPNTPALVSPLLRNYDSEGGSKTRPNLLYTLEMLIERVRLAYPIMTQGKFVEAMQAFRGILHQTIVSGCKDGKQASELEEVVQICREYLLGLSLETARRELTGTDPVSAKRSLELASYFTHCSLQSVHLQLAIRLAMVQSFKLRNFGTAKSFAQRLLEQGPNAQVAASANKILAHCERVTSNAVVLDYDQYNPFVICGASLTPIYQGGGEPPVLCPCCGTSYRREFAGGVCVICEVGKVGGRATGRVAIL